MPTTRDRPDGGVRPGRDEIHAAFGRSIPDVVAPGLRVLFCGINPSLYSGATGHHFARPGNRFWRALHGAGFTDAVLQPGDDAALLAARIGITNLVNRATATAAEVSAEELRIGAARLRDLAERYRPGVVAVVGVSAYRTAFERPKASIGPQPEQIGPSRLWVLPNPSGLNAGYQLPALVSEFGRLRETLDARRAS